MAKPKAAPLLSFVDAAEQILCEEWKPISHNQLAEKAIQKHLIQTESETPGNGMRASVRTEMRRRDAPGDSRELVGEGLVLDGLDRDGEEVCVAGRLEHRLGVAAIGPGSVPVSAGLVSGEEHDAVVEARGDTGAGMGGTASFEEYGRGRVLREEGPEIGVLEAVPRGDLFGDLGITDLEDVLRAIDRDDGLRDAWTD